MHREMEDRSSKVSRGARATLLGVLALVCALAFAAQAGGHTLAKKASEAPASLQLGSQTLSRCASKPLAYCGKLEVPLDYSSPAGPDIAISFRFYPASAGAAKGTVVPVEGGPGYPSIESVSYSSGLGQAGYAPMYGALLEHWNMLAIDNRGTGASAGIRCPALQEYSATTGTSAFQKVVGECAGLLNSHWRYPNRSFVHASDLFTSAPAAEDMAAVLRALGLGKIDLYGDSYGSFFAQVFASRFPSMVRSLILDSTYRTSGLDPWYRSSVKSMPGAFEQACTRAPACAAAEPEPVWSRVSALASSLRAKPISGTVPGPSGKRQKVTMGIVGLVDLVNDSAEDKQIYAQLDAAARALLQEGDSAPLLRLYAQRLAVDEAYFGLPVSEYSVGLYFAVGCLDYPQLFSMASSPSARTGELAAAEAALPASTFSPFTTSEWLSMDENTEAYTGCEDWPSPVNAQPPVPEPPPVLPASMPVLALGGELDTWTPPSDVPELLAKLGGHTQFVELANSTHVVGEGETVCGSALIRAFVANPAKELDTSCAPAVAAIHSVGVYPGKLAAEQPITPTAGSTASPSALRLAAAALQTAGDAIARYSATEASTDHGLYGGTATATNGGATIALKNDQLIAGVPVSGTLTLTPAPLAEDGETVVATLTASGEGIRKASFTATWTTSGSAAVARIGGEASGTMVSGTAPAP